jgi:hypothetical protein
VRKPVAADLVRPTVRALVSTGFRRMKVIQGLTGVLDVTERRRLMHPLVKLGLGLAALENGPYGL